LYVRLEELIACFNCESPCVLTRWVGDLSKKVFWIQHSLWVTVLDKNQAFDYAIMLLTENPNMVNPRATISWTKCKSNLRSISKFGLCLSKTGFHSCLESWTYSITSSSCQKYFDFAPQDPQGLSMKLIFTLTLSFLKFAWIFGVRFCSLFDRSHNLEHQLVKQNVCCHSYPPPMDQLAMNQGD